MSPYILKFFLCFAKLILNHIYVNVFLFFLKVLFIFRERGREGDREGEKHQCVVVSHAPPTGDLSHNLGMCPDWESNWWPFGSQASTQSRATPARATMYIFNTFINSFFHWMIFEQPVNARHIAAKQRCFLPSRSLKSSAMASAGNGTGDLLIRRLALSPLNPSSQGSLNFLFHTC